MNKCRNCRTELRTDHAFCPKCGFDLRTKKLETINQVITPKVITAIKYFYTKGEIKYGPFSLEELVNQNIGPQTLIWFDGLDDWKEAESFDELKETFESSPPPPDTENYNSMSMKDRIIPSILLASFLTSIWSITRHHPISISSFDLLQFLSDVIVGQIALHIPALLICFIVYAFNKKFNFILYNIIICLIGVFLIAGKSIIGFGSHSFTNLSTPDYTFKFEATVVKNGLFDEDFNGPKILHEYLKPDGYLKVWYNDKSSKVVYKSKFCDREAVIIEFEKEGNHSYTIEANDLKNTMPFIAEIDFDKSIIEISCRHNDEHYRAVHVFDIDKLKLPADNE